MALGIGIGLGLSKNQGLVAARAKELDERSYELLLPYEIVRVEKEVGEGSVIQALAFPWQRIFDQLQSNPELLFEFSKSHRSFEEFIAATYEKNGFEVTLTPSSGDGGRDVIAERPSWGAIRIIDQCKAFRRGRTVSPNDVRAMMGVLYRDRNASKAVISTTSKFAPSVYDEWTDFMPNRLELREGDDILSWLKMTKSGVQ